MYAIIVDGGKQYKVSPGMLIDLENKDYVLGNHIEFSQVVYYHSKKEVQIGTPLISNIKVKGIIENYTKGPKITVIKYRRSKDSRRKQGHRQSYTQVRIAEIVKE